jgi:hypothetical protein
LGLRITISDRYFVKNKYDKGRSTVEIKHVELAHNTGSISWSWLDIIPYSIVRKYKEIQADSRISIYFLKFLLLVFFPFLTGAVDVSTQEST